METIEDLFNKLQNLKKEQKGIKAAYKEALGNNGDYAEVIEKLKQLREQKKQMENIVKQQFSREFEKLESLQFDMAEYKETLTDLALSKMAKGEDITFLDQYQTKYEPVFNIAFKKV